MKSPTVTFARYFYKHTLDNVQSQNTNAPSATHSCFKPGGEIQQSERINDAVHELLPGILCGGYGGICL